jgi:hypothetical protein
VDQPAHVHLADCRRERDRDAQKLRHIHRLAEQLIERLAAGILEQQRRSIAFAAKRERPRRPRGVERVPQFIFMGKAIED